MSLLLADLPPSPFLVRWFLEAPVFPALLLAAVCGLVAWRLNERGRARAALQWGLAALIAGAAVILTGMMVETEGEKLIRRNREFVGLILASDAARARDYLAEDLVISSGGRVLAEFDREWMLAVIRDFDRTIGITDSSFGYRGASLDAPGIGRTHFSARVFTSYHGGPHATTWEIEWRRDAAGPWRVTRFNWLTYFGDSPPVSWMGGLRTGSFN